MPYVLEPVNSLTSPSSKMVKDITKNNTDDYGNTLLDLFAKKMSPDNQGVQCSIGPKEKTNVTYASLSGYRIDLQKYNNNGSANFALQTNERKSVTLAALFMPPNTNFSGDLVQQGFTASLTSEGRSACQLTLV